MPVTSGTIHVGTSGWQYAHWRGAFYPQSLPQSAWLAHYASEFRTVEVNASFYRLPEQAPIDRWRASVPRGFLFAVKAPRSITHFKKLKGCETLVQTALTRLGRLGDALGPVLFQLPPRWRANTRRLEAFLEMLPAGRRYAFELRDRSWHTPEVLDLLARAGAAYCIYDLAGFTTPLETTADFVYVRLHGPATAYSGSYRPERLRTWAGRARGWAREGRDVHVYFDNDERAWAARNARRLIACLTE